MKTEYSSGAVPVFTVREVEQIVSDPEMRAEIEKRRNRIAADSRRAMRELYRVPFFAVNRRGKWKLRKPPVHRF